MRTGQGRSDYQLLSKYVVREAYLDRKIPRLIGVISIIGLTLDYVLV
jgi:hypothetical protein